MVWEKIWSREYSVQYSEVAIRSISEECRHLLGGLIRRKFILSDAQGIQTGYASAQEWRRFGDGLVAKFLSTPGRFETFKKTFHLLGKKYLAESRNLSRQAKRARTPAALGALYSRFYPAYRDYCAVLWAGYILN
ncbi:MAG TPA: hypothetical protein VI874_01160, partial [Candidatus Norongarragalinales archaeon]|nr:hypothetical protein [Candidatus Norongarragalinales archaeon]